MFKTVLILLIAAAASGCSTLVQGDLNEREANEMMLALAEAGIEANKLGNATGWSVEVGSGDLSRAWRVLRVAGLPRPRHTGFLEVYKERALVPGRMEEQALYLSALQEEIAQTLESVEGVVSARVHASVKSEGRPGRVQHSVATASVLIGFRPTQDGSVPLSESDVQKLTANAVAGLAPDKVAVVFTPRRAVVLPTLAAELPGGWSPLKLVALGVAALALVLAAAMAMRRLRVKAMSCRSTARNQ